MLLYGYLKMETVLLVDGKFVTLGTVTVLYGTVLGSCLHIYIYIYISFLLLGCSKAILNPYL